MTTATKAKRQADPDVIRIRIVKRLGARVREPQREYLRSVAGWPTDVEASDGEDT